MKPVIFPFFIHEIMVIAIDNFFGCYLLYCTNPKYKGRTYIGFTVNPERRIGQHNAGKHKGGAWKTSGRGPWDMTLIVHGFPSDVAALRFEWAWQNPDRSRRLKHVAPKQRKESAFQFRVRVMASMLCQTPWKRLPLTVRWLKQEYAIEFNIIPPNHMPIAYGPVTAKVKRHKIVETATPLPHESDSPKHNNEKESSGNDDSDEECMSLMERLASKSSKLKTKSRSNSARTIASRQSNGCILCSKSLSVDNTIITCLGESCSMSAHITCLAKHFLKNEKPFQLLPVEGSCPKCECSLLWGELIRQTQGFHQHLKGYAV